jgi:hypothetical protein
MGSPSAVVIKRGRRRGREEEEKSEKVEIGSDFLLFFFRCTAARKEPLGGDRSDASKEREIKTKGSHTHTRVKRKKMRFLYVYLSHSSSPLSLFFFAVLSSKNGDNRDKGQ